MGEEKFAQTALVNAVQGAIAVQPQLSGDLRVATPGGMFQVRWDENASASALGQLAFFGEYLDVEHWMRANLTAEEIENCREGLLAFAPDGQGLTGATKNVLQDFYATFKTAFDAGNRDWIATWAQDREAFNASWANWSAQDRDLALKISDVMADVADYASVCISQGYEQWFCRPTAGTFRCGCCSVALQDRHDGKGE